MNIQKRKKYIESLYAALHTLSGKASQVNCEKATDELTIKQCSIRKIDGVEYIYLQLNPNKVVPTTLLLSFSEFEKVLTSTLQSIEAKEFQITRADMSLNSNNPNDYELFQKLNRLLICCISQAYGITNCYQSFDLWSNKSLSVAIKSDSIEAENYNKFLESHGLVETTNRLELRSKSMTTNDLKREFTVKWFDRLDKAVEQFENVQKRYNTELVRIWNEDAAKPKRERDFVSMTSFLLRYKNCIFTRKQLEDLYRQMGVEKYESRAKKFKEKYHIEFYSKTDLEIIVKAIKRAIKNYFKN